MANKINIETRVRVVADKCAEMAFKLRQMSLPAPKEDVPPLGFAPEEEANFWFFLAAICHQTSPVGLPALEGNVEGKQRRGWDYLVHAFRVAATKDLGLLSPLRWATFTVKDLGNIFGPLLSLPDARCELIVDLGQRLCERHWNSILLAHINCKGYLREHSPNLLDTLSEFQAFSDPVEKKSVFFLALMQNCGLWEYCDSDRLPAPVDYHEVRGHLRIGTVRIEDNELEKKIWQGLSVTKDDDVTLRLAVREAIQNISVSVGKSPNALHYLFWNLFRTYCIRTTPLCEGQAFEKLPPEYAKSVADTGARDCPFRGFCCSADQVDAINEHKITTEYY